MSDHLIKKNDFIELLYTGYANGEIFDSNIEHDLKLINPDSKAKKLIIAVGQDMVVKGFDKALEGKEIGKEYEISLSPKDAFGERKREMIRTIPLKAFREKNVNPQPGMVLTLDNMMAKIIAVSGARVITDFNNPLAGKELKYKFTIVRKVEDEKEKVEALFDVFFSFIPDYKIAEKITIHGTKMLEYIVKAYNPKFKEILGKELDFVEKKEEKKEETPKEHKHEKEEIKKEHVHEVKNKEETVTPTG